ncbi:MAG: hypothetical protein ACJ72H_04835 [Candidatus Sulfotelmatobacter sp.]
MRLFASRQSACAFGVPNKKKDAAKADGAVKSGMDYRTEPGPFLPADVALHLQGRQSIVAIPLLDDGTCMWGCIDIDKRCPKPHDLDLNWFLSKSQGWHGFAFFDKPKTATSVRAWLSFRAELLGFKGCEVFPKQTSTTGKGTGVNLPFFGDPTGLAAFEPRIWTRDLPEPAVEETSAYGEDEDGYWTDDSLQAMLAFYAETVPGFEWRPCRGGFSVPCPGYDEGWEDGARHSANMFPRISHESLVFLRRGWPKFRCVHSHCDGVKTFNMWREHWDPLRLWSWEEWVEGELAQRGDYVRF